MATFGIKSVISVLDRATAPLDKINKAINKTFSPIRKLHNATKQLSKGLGIPKVGRAFTNLRTSISGVGNEVRSLGREFMVVGGIASAAVAGIAIKTGNAGDAVAKTAQKIGITSDAWSKLSYAGNLSGVSAESMKSSLTKLNKTVIDAAKGGKEAQYWFKAAGVSIYDQVGKLRSTDDILGDVANKFADPSFTNGPARAALAMGLLGRSGADMIPLLKEGKVGIEAFGKEAERRGTVFTDEESKQCEVFCDAITNLQEAIRGVAITIGKEIIPTMTEWIMELDELVISSRELIGTKVSDWIEDLNNEQSELRKQLAGLWDEVSAFTLKVDELVQSLGGWSEVMPYLAAGLAALKLIPLAASLASLTMNVISLGGALGDFLVKSIALVGGALKDVGVFLIANPIVLIIASIAAVAYLIYKNWDWIGPWFADLWEGIKNAFASAWEWIKGVFTPVTAWFSGIWDEILAGFDAGLVTELMVLFEKLSPAVWIAEAIDAVIEIFTGKKAVFADLGMGLIQGLWDGLKSMWGSVTGWLSKKVDELTAWMPDFVREGLGLKASVSAVDVAADIPTVDIPASTTAEPFTNDPALAREIEHLNAMQDLAMDAMNLERSLAMGEMPSPPPGQQSPALRMAAQQAQRQSAPQQGEVRVVFENTPPGAKVIPRNADIQVGRDALAGAYDGVRMGG